MIEYRAKSAEGKVRHPVFKGIREDQHHDCLDLCRYEIPRRSSHLPTRKLPSGGSTVKVDDHTARRSREISCE